MQNRKSRNGKKKAAKPAKTQTWRLLSLPSVRLKPIRICSNYG
nr:MAG TPA: hypothetical protein [Caudoviricetes sp.]